MSRKRFFVLLTILMVLTLAACTGTTDVPPEDQSQGAPADAGMDTEASPDSDADADTSSDSDTDQDGADETAVIDAAALYSARCSSCHGTDRQGVNGPPLLPANLTRDASSYVNTITNGSGPMPSWGSRLSADEINALVEFILSDVE